MTTQIKEITEILGLIVLVSTVLGLLYKFVREFFTRVSLYWKKWTVAFEQLEYVYKEVKPDSGSTLYDKINTISRQLDLARKEQLIQHTVVRHIRDDMTSTAYCEFDSSGNLVFANKKMQELVGLTEYMLKDGKWLAIIPEASQGAVYDRWMDSIEKKTPFQATFTVKKNDLIYTCVLKTEQILDTKGDLIYIIGKIVRIEP